MVSSSARDKTTPACEPSELTTPVISTLPCDRSCRPNALVRVKGLEPPTSLRKADFESAASTVNLLITNQYLFNKPHM
jgi:hypothetical protein